MVLGLGLLFSGPVVATAAPDRAGKVEFFEKQGFGAPGDSDLSMDLVTPRAEIFSNAELMVAVGGCDIFDGAGTRRV